MTTAMYVYLREIERERDEAREALKQAASFAAEREHNAMQALAHKAERDEAREQRDLLVRALDECMVVNNLGVFNLGDDPKAALQKICRFEQEVGAYYANAEVSHGANNQKS